MKKQATRVIILGAGFGGLHCAKGLMNQAGIDVTLIDRRNFHLFQPLLYQVATGSLNPADIAVPIRHIFKAAKNMSIILGDVTRADIDNKMIWIGEESLSFDYLVMSGGSRPHYFGHPEWEEFAPSLKSLEDAVEIRRRLFLALENAEIEKNHEVKREWLTFGVIGGGPTGVELAGAIGEISFQGIKKHYRNFCREDISIYLIEGGPRILPTFKPELASYAASELKNLGVTVMTNSVVTSLASDHLCVSRQIIRLKTMIWAAGVNPSELNQSLNIEKDRAGRIRVNSTLSLESHPQVFVIGDQAAFKISREGESEKILPGNAPVAIQQGLHVAKLILLDHCGRNRVPFSFKDKGNLATIGRAKAIAQFQNRRYTGFLAWVLWCVVHIYFLIGFRNKVFVLLQWAWAYIRFQHGTSLIAHSRLKSH